MLHHAYIVYVQSCIVKIRIILIDPDHPAEPPEPEAMPSYTIENNLF